MEAEIFIPRGGSSSSAWFWFVFVVVVCSLFLFLNTTILCHPLPGPMGLVHDGHMFYNSVTLHSQSLPYRSWNLLSALSCLLDLVILPLDKLGSYLVGPVCVLGGFWLWKWVLPD